MSRYTIPAQDPRYVVVVGFDNPFDTFFCEVCDTAAEDDDTACILWEGTIEGEEIHFTRSVEGATTPAMQIIAKRAQ